MSQYDPPDLDSHNAKYAANVQYVGRNVDTGIVYPCPFCAEPEWLAVKMTNMDRVLQMGAVCQRCGRGCYHRITDRPEGRSIAFVQFTGEPPPPYIAGLFFQGPPVNAALFEALAKARSGDVDN